MSHDIMWLVISINFTVYKGSPSGKIVKGSTHKDLRPDEVLLRVTHAGLCGTDLHHKNEDIGLSHEGVGIVEKIGSEVVYFKVYVSSFVLLCSNLVTRPV
ncbi:hypothetical protein EDD17DRAFT_158388 [Pisolithus thermaeus]|nr:hypothetical protein EDD17DRAFT_158388 [Pisolithus thermaeus]